LNGIELLEMDRTVLARALEWWPTPIRTLDALHLATLEYVGRREAPVQLAGYDHRMLAAARALGILIAEL
jgi:hypothetical protein